MVPIQPCFGYILLYAYPFMQYRFDQGVSMSKRKRVTSLFAIGLLFIGLSGQAIADRFRIANSASPETSYDIAFDGTNFLVAIEAETVGAQLVSPSGELIGSFISTGRSGSSGGDATIANRREGGPGLPHVAFDGTNYLLVWTEGWTSEGTAHVAMREKRKAKHNIRTENA